MTRVKFFADGVGITGFSVSGHSSQNCDDEEGKLVCAAVSGAVYMAANTISEVIGDHFDYEERDGKFILTTAQPSEHTRIVLQGFALHLNGLSEQYPNRIKIITEV